MSPLERVREYLKTMPQNPQIIEFEQSTHTSELAAQALGVETGQIAKSILLISNNGPLMVVTCGDKRIQQKKIKESIGSKVRFANADEVNEITGYAPGGVCPFALKNELPIYIDASMKKYPVVYAAAGTPNTAVPVSFQDLVDITGGEECDFCE